MAEGLRIYNGARKYLLFPVDFTVDGIDTDPTDDPVHFAFTIEADAPDDEAEWSDGDWETDGTTYWARVLVGTPLKTGGDVDLEPATYRVWVRITDSPEVPVERAGTLQVAN